MKNCFSYMLENFGPAKWWEETGHPRYCKFAPDEVYDIHAKEVALLNIACQGCGKDFMVSMSWKDGQGRDFEDTPSLSKKVKNGSVDYGDPPNVGCCAAGNCMQCVNLRVLEFWAKDGSLKWARIPGLEIKLPKRW